MTESVERTLGRIEGKLDAALKEKDRLEADLRLLDKRVTHLEMWRYGIVSVSVVLLSLIGVAYKIVLGLNLVGRS